MLRTQHPPKTVMEIFKMLPEGTLAEIINDQIFMSPSPLSKHQKLLNKLNNKIYNYLEPSGKGEVFPAPLDVYLDETSNAVQPDIIVVLNESRKIVNEDGHIHGSPDLLVEVLSPTNKDYDLIKKKELYEKFGVKEYWIVDPDTRQAVVYSLLNKKYHKVSERVATIDSPLLKTTIDF